MTDGLQARAKRATLPAMRLFLLTALTMLAFAGNSLLNRFAVADAAMAPTSFALVRVLAGAGILVLLLAVRHARTGVGMMPHINGNAVGGVIGLTTYLAGFSLAYLELGAGPGALILFGCVQITMFAGAVMRGQRLALRRVLGAGVAFAGLLTLLWPGATPLPLLAAMAMVAAGIGWGIYSLAGSTRTDPLAGTAVNFVLAAPVMALIWWGMGAAPLGGLGLGAAIASGAITSGLGYALWYAVIPGLGAQRAAVAQLCVPVIAAAGGALWLGEGVGWRFGLASVLVLGGVALASLQRGITGRS